MVGTVARMTKRELTGCSKRQPTRLQERENRRRTLWGTLRILSSRERRLGKGASWRAGAGRVKYRSFQQPGEGEHERDSRD